MLSGDDGSAEQNNIGVFLAEVMWVGEERDAEFLGGAGVVRSRVGEDSVALRDEGFGEELAVVAEAYDGDFEVVRGG